jgi:hypothetical protein
MIKIAAAKRSLYGNVGFGCYLGKQFANVVLRQMSAVVEIWNDEGLLCELES